MTDAAILFADFGGPEVLQISQVAREPLAPDEVRITVLAFALNRADLMFIHGEHYTIPDFPSRIGSEATGVVVEVGSAVTRFAVGDRVCSLPFFTTRHGVQGTSAILPEDYLTLAPSTLDDEESCSVWMQYLTPYFAFRDVADLQPGDTVLVTAAASSAGLGALQIARALGVRTVATTRSASKVDVLRENGATTVVVTGTDDLRQAIADTSGGTGLAAAFDPVAGSSLAGYVDELAPGATVLGYGTLSDEQPVVPVAAMCRAQAVFHPYSMFNHIGDPDQRDRACEFIRTRIESGELQPKIDRVFDFDDAIEAYRYMESNAQAGKIVVRVGS